MFLRNLSKFILVAIYVAVIILQMIYFVPCKKMIMRLSNDGTSHLNTIGNSYATIFEIEKSFKVNEEDGKQATCKTIDTQQLFINTMLTTIIAGAIYFLFLYKNDKKSSVIAKTETEVVEPPYIDLNELAFADPEEQKKAQKDYADAMYRYVKSKLK